MAGAGGTGPEGGGERAGRSGVSEEAERRGRADFQRGEGREGRGRAGAWGWDYTKGPGSVACGAGSDARDGARGRVIPPLPGEGIDSGGERRGVFRGTRGLWVATLGVGRVVVLLCALAVGCEAQYTCIGGDTIDIDRAIGGSVNNHLASWGQGGQRGQTAPCGIRKTYTAYEDHDLGDGNRGAFLWGGAQGLSCSSNGVCTGKEQDQPVQLLGTDSHGCCCSAGSIGLGLPISTYVWTGAASLRFMECDFQLQRCSGGSCVTETACVPEVCQFEITRMPAKGTMHSVNQAKQRDGILSGCSLDTPCVVKPSFNPQQRAVDNLVGDFGRWETNRLIFAGYPGDVGECPVSDNRCFGQPANLFYQQQNQGLWTYGDFEFRIRTFTWQYGTENAGEQVEFQRSGDNYPERVEDAYKKFIYNGLYQPFTVEACPCALTGASSFTCSGGISFSCTQVSGVYTKGHLVIIDFKTMTAVHAGSPTLCTCTPGPFVPGTARCPPDTTPCYTQAELDSMKAQVAAGCAASGACFSVSASNPCPSGCTGRTYPLFRAETGLGEPSVQTARIVPYNDRPSVGGAGNALRFDGIDDMAAAAVTAFPREAFTVMLWIKGLQTKRPLQGVLQYVTPANGVQLQLHNTQNLEVSLHGYSSGPTGIDVNSDLQWHHVALAWTSQQRYINDNTLQPAGQLRIYIDCTLTPYRQSPRASQSTAPGGEANYTCARAVGGVGGDQWAWSGVLGPNINMSAVGEVSLGQRMACNATTRELELDRWRKWELEANNTFCRRKVRVECNASFNVTVSPYVPNIYAPEGDCTETVLGVFLSAGDNFSSCVRNASDPYTTIKRNPILREMVRSWMWSNDVYPTLGSEGPPYRIPELTDGQLQLRMQSMCVAGCFDEKYALFGYLDELRMYNYSMSSREIAFVNSDTVRDGVNCVNKQVFYSLSLPPEDRCSHMIDKQYKRGLVLYWPFDDPWSMYGATTDSSSIFPGKRDPKLKDVGQVTYNAIGNYASNDRFSMWLGNGFSGTSPMLVPSTVPVFGAQYDFYYYPIETYHLIKVNVKDQDTCVFTNDVLEPFTDSVLNPTCNQFECSDSHCSYLQVRLRAASSVCSPSCFGTVYRAQVRAACRSDQAFGICSPFPDCIGERCLEVSTNRMFGTGQALTVDRFYLYTGEWLDEGIDLEQAGRKSHVLCDNGACTTTSFRMSAEASSVPTGQVIGSYTGYSVMLELGDKKEYRNIICHGDRRCDPAVSFPLPGTVVTVRTPFSFVPTTDAVYTIYKGSYDIGYYHYYYSNAVGTAGVGADVLKYEVKDAPGEAGTLVSAIQPINSQQQLLFRSDINGDDPVALANWNQPQMEGTIIIAPMNVPIPMPTSAEVPEDMLSVIELDFVLDEDTQRRGFNVTVNGPQAAANWDRGLGIAGPVTETGEMYQALEVHCGAVSPTASCTVLQDGQISRANGKGAGSEPTVYCDDGSYTQTNSLYQELIRQDPLHATSGLVSIICTYNLNRTEIYNVTGYNYTCLPPCQPTQYSFQILAPGCINNCTLKERGFATQCLNTYGLYPDDWVCRGGVFHGQACLGFTDVLTCNTIGGGQAQCVGRDAIDGLGGRTNLKASALINKDNVGLMVHTVMLGDLHFIDWMHRGARVKWNEIVVDTAAGLGHTLTVQYLIRNGCPWRSSAIYAAVQRGWGDVVQFLTALLPPRGAPSYTCGCGRLELHPNAQSAARPRCFPFQGEFECFQRCGSDPLSDPSCVLSESFYLEEWQTVSDLRASPDEPPDPTKDALALSNGIYLAYTPPATTVCAGTGSTVALVRGPKMVYLDDTIRRKTSTERQLRVFAGSRIGFSDSVELCQGELPKQPGAAPVKVCAPPGPLTLFGSNFDFLNYHVSDRRLRIIFLPPRDRSGRVAVFNVTSSRLRQFPYESQGAPFLGFPIGARIESVDISIIKHDDVPNPAVPITPLQVTEDKMTVMQLKLDDPDTPTANVRALISTFPAHGTLYQVVGSAKAPNMTFSNEYQTMGYRLPPNVCETAHTDCVTRGVCDCLDGNCDAPRRNCSYTGETFSVGDPIQTTEATLRLLPTVILNSSSGVLLEAGDAVTQALIKRYAEMGGTLPCYGTTRYWGADEREYIGPPFCDFADQEILLSSCRRCTKVLDSRMTNLSFGAWSGRLMYEPVHLQRHRKGLSIEAPSDPEQGGSCSYEELCALGANTASKSTCIEWSRLGPDGRPTPNIRPEGVARDPRDVIPDFLSAPYAAYGSATNPCKGASDPGPCVRGTPGEYLWPNTYDLPALGVSTAYTMRNLTEFGDPVDEDSFYNTCGSLGIEQFRALYERAVYMNGFELRGLPIRSDVRFRILARTQAQRVDRTTETVVTGVASMGAANDGGDVSSRQIIATSQKVTSKAAVTGCGGAEWREVWRGNVSEGRFNKPEKMDNLQGRQYDYNFLSFKFHSLNFTTSELILEACGLSGQGPQNNEGGNVIEGLESLVLIGTADTPRGLVTDELKRVAYIPHPNFVGTDTFTYRGDDAAPPCVGIECDSRTDRKERVVTLNVNQVNDRPTAPQADIVGKAAQPVLINLVGVDALNDDVASKWRDLSKDDPSLFGGGYPVKIPDFAGGEDGEPDNLLTAQITSAPDRGTITYLGGVDYQFDPTPGDGGAPYAIVRYTVTDPQGLVSEEGLASITINCPPGQHILQERRTCVDCPRGHYNNRDDAATACTPCPTGYYTPSTASFNCTPCTAGSFTGQTGTPECVPCRPGTFTDRGLAQTCQPCDTGKFSPRFGSTTCYECGDISYAPLQGMSRCYDCPTYSRAVSRTSDNVGQCECIAGSYTKGFFDDFVYQPWSEDGWGSDNGSVVAPRVPAIEDAWPLRLGQIGANCTLCPHGAHCHGRGLPPMTLTGFWTDWESEGKEFWEDPISPQFYACDSRNVREVCLGYSLLDIQERYEVCTYRRNDGVCDDWPLQNYTVPKDPRRCKAGYEGVLCSQCVDYTLEQCVPLESDADDGWFWYKSNAVLKAQASFFGQPFVDCYEIGGCERGINDSECGRRRDACNNASDVCRWDSGRYYRAYDGFCAKCPLPVGAFIIYMIWFGAYGLVIVLIIRLALSDLISLQITFTFWQCAALLARFRVPWPALAQSSLSGFSVANVNLDGFPWKCFFDTMPSYRDLWYLTIFVPPGAMVVAIVRWILPFLTVPPSGKALIRAFKSAMKRRDNLKGTASVVRQQYTAVRNPPVDELRPASGASGGVGSRGSARSMGSASSTRPLLQEPQRVTSHGAGVPTAASIKPYSSGGSSGGTEERPSFSRGSARTGSRGGSRGGDMLTVSWTDDLEGAGVSGGQGAGGRRPSGMSIASADLSLQDVGLEERLGNSPTQPEQVLGQGFGSPSRERKGGLGHRNAQGRGVRGAAELVSEDRGSFQYPNASTSIYIPRRGRRGLSFSNTNDGHGGAQETLNLSHISEEAGSPASPPRPLLPLPGARCTPTQGNVLASPGLPRDALSPSDGAFPQSDMYDAGAGVFVRGLGGIHVYGARFGSGVDEAAAAHGPERGRRAGSLSVSVRIEEGTGGSSGGVGPTRVSGVGFGPGEERRDTKWATQRVAGRNFGPGGDKEEGGGAGKDKKGVGKQAGKEGEEVPKKRKGVLGGMFSSGAAKAGVEPPLGVLRVPPPDMLVIDETGDLCAVSRPESAFSRSSSAAAAHARPSSWGLVVTFPPSPTRDEDMEHPMGAKSHTSTPPDARPASRGGGGRRGSGEERNSIVAGRPGSSGGGLNRPGSQGGLRTDGDVGYRKPRTPNRGVALAQIEAVRLGTPSRMHREQEGYREWSLKNPTQGHTPRMEQRLDTFRSTGSSKELSVMPNIGIAWYVRRQYFDLAWRACIALTQFFYIMAAVKSLEIFRWTFWTRAKAVLDEDPNVALFGNYHLEVFPIGIIVMPVYVGAPVLHYLFIYIGHKRKIMDEPSFAMRWGYLLDPFERRYWYWGLLVTVRKFAFVFARVFLHQALYVQKFLPAFVVCANLIGNYWVRPYRIERHNVLENLLLYCLLLLVLLMLISPLDIVLYHDYRGRSLEGPYEYTITGGVQLVQLFSVVCCTVCIYADIVDAQLYMPWYIRWVWNIVAGPVMLVLGVLQRVAVFIIIWVFKALKRKPPSILDKQAAKQRYYNPATQMGKKPPVVSGRPYADIFWEQVMKLRGKKAGVVLPEFEEEEEELVRPDDGAKWLRDKFAIHKRVFLLEKRLHLEATFDPKSVKILRTERELTVALDAALEQARRDADELFDQLYDAQTSFEALTEEHNRENKKLLRDEESLDHTMERVRYAKAKLDSMVRRVGQPEDWRRRFLEEQAKRHALEQEIVDLQAQVDAIRLDAKDEDEDSD